MLFQLKKHVKLLVVFLFIVPCSIKAQNTVTNRDLLGQYNNAITTAVPFLMIGPDSRTGGMGEVGVALPDDMNAQHWNASKYVFSENKGGFSVSYSPWLQGLVGVKDIYLIYLSGYYKFTEMDAVSASLRYFSMGSMELMDDGGINPLGDGVSVSPHEFAIDVAYSRKLTKELSMSLSGRFIYSNLTTAANISTNTLNLKPGMAGAADIGLFYKKKLGRKSVEGNTICFGLNFSNIGNKISYSDDISAVLQKDFLPANFRIGVAYVLDIDKYNRMTFAFDLNKLLVPTTPIYLLDSNGKNVLDAENKKILDPAKGMIEPKNLSDISVFEALYRSWLDAPGGALEELREFIFNVGIEYAYNDLLFIRAGYFNEAKTKGWRKYLTVGVGIKYSVFCLDASYIIPVSQRNHPLQNTLRFSLSFDFGAASKRKKESRD